ncbi:protein of unknown function [Methylorubrum extorquens]|uniref:Uncharacterized protein n=1 Tax=Methylorubrum extorquens TaxID=408 RepID=A0A2N9AYV6_METEX|nr:MULTISPECIES: hypothetical protein [Methylobacteriaceae]KQQ01176.1 hypothetical protein ASF59_03075 [Methylobacterium sp. Leaf121]KQQ11519.1 hypothetical protein ASF56_24805 [Methylobacterium sp. Leaf122]WHQ70520.1 hypothetical protein KEC54_02475 [Methylorubrum extorquens]SOR32505.1 protein of unknown function [Methylorubrum extorquens]
MTEVDERCSTVLADFATEAEREATNSGMDIHEFQTALKGETITTLIPPGSHETLTAYGLRATSEILVQYLMDDLSVTP